MLDEKRLNVRLTNEEDEKLQELADKQKRSKSNLIKLWIDEHYKAEVEQKKL